ncbi:prolipoprotein diacylglyceryl transferase [Candidatus Woesearchaeota archaeon]|nr:prolipoprotein diacylglyceryl transferase [Candidatus Woesearchaeota archaeon]
MFIHNLNPVILSLGPLQIRYYGLVFAFGFLLAHLVLLKAAEKKKIKNFDKEAAYDLTLYVILGTILGARLIFELVYNLPEFLSNPLHFFLLWKGGLSFHGGIIGASLAAYYFLKKRRIQFYPVADVLVIPLALMLGFGRIANFLNGELWGTVTSVSWAVKFPLAEGFRHPSQLYEAAKNFFIFGVLLYVKDLKLKKGTLFWSFVGLYGALRFLVTFYREAEYYFFGIGIGQWLSLLMVPIAGFMLYKIHK